MSKRHYPPFSRLAKLNKWQPNHLFVITGPGAFEYAKSLYQSNQCQPVLPCPENISPELYQWPVIGLDVTIKNLGSSESDTETLIYELLKAGANLVVNVDSITGAVTVYRPEGLPDAA